MDITKTAICINCEGESMVLVEEDDGYGAALYRCIFCRQTETVDHECFKQ